MNVNGDKRLQHVVSFNILGNEKCISTYIMQHSANTFYSRGHMFHVSKVLCDGAV